MEKKELNRFSFSGISTFRNCPKSFEYHYIEEIPAAFCSVEAHMGTTVHEVIRWAYERRAGQKPDPSLVELKTQYTGFWKSEQLEAVKVIKKGRGESDYFNLGFDLTVAFFQRVFAADKSESCHLEHEFVIPLNDHVNYKGVIDRLSRQPDGRLRITDFKTGRVGHPLDTLQLPSYALFVFEQNPDDEIELCYEDLKEGRTVVVPFKREEVDSVRQRLFGHIQEIHAADDFEARPSMLCLWCGYNHICPKAQSDSTVVQKPKTVESEDGEPEFFCPKCGSALKRRKGKFGDFLGCTGYPNCRYTMDVKEFENVERDGSEICPECGGTLRERKGRFGSFFGCSNFPRCRYSRDK
jgi:RecB family exonuclease/uncharacterized C2H2 Zn-finger protein